MKKEPIKDEVLNDVNDDANLELWQKKRTFSRGSSVCEVGCVYDEHVPLPRDVRCLYSFEI